KAALVLHEERGLQNRAAFIFLYHETQLLCPAPRNSIIPDTNSAFFEFRRIGESLAAIMSNRRGSKPLRPRGPASRNLHFDLLRPSGFALGDMQFEHTIIEF